MPNPPLRYTVRFTNAAYQSIEDQIVFLAGYHGQATALSAINELLDEISIKLVEFPMRWAVSEEASSLGILQYRKMIIGRYRIFFEIYEEQRDVVVHMVLRHKQSSEQALIRYCLIGPIF
ncbi:type II toxin-antitoxin system RelE/ParE family toxin [Pseudomonas sp. LP_7_YM]|uniref:type II toxin-antitoxin system RelE/ParE family toxin n=1 Tax=Pseudomonas sp. LP_7_YM TaxID=2485137 RepID=UPI00106049A4|nr:type II toxin-antitoxin system RelE/ParE family toxin [Pseudomonas sp. LP_7_YM]TDV71871.1 ParE-like toxin of type II ParDE toxin-antitoxin system [Pseudomonas sp. LP_7_YM]